MRYRIIARAMLRELWINWLASPCRLIPHPARPVRVPADGGYRCSRCGSRSARVQRKGRDRARLIRERFA